MPIKFLVPEKLEERNMSIKEFSEKAGIAYNTALSLKRGSLNRIDFGTLDKLCELFACKVGDLLEYIPPTSTAE